MSIDKKLTQIAKKQQRVYEAGYIRGRNSNAYDEGYMQCVNDTLLASQMPFFLTPLNARQWTQNTSILEGVTVEKGVFYNRFTGYSSSLSRNGISVALVAPDYAYNEEHINGKYLVFKIKTDYKDWEVDLHTYVKIVGDDHVDNRHDVWPGSNKSDTPEEWSVYVMDISDICTNYKKDENGQYPIINYAGVFFSVQSTYGMNHTRRHVDFAYSAVCATHEQVADLIKNDTAYLWTPADRQWNEFDPLTDLN